MMCLGFSWNVNHTGPPDGTIKNFKQKILPHTICTSVRRPSSGNLYMYQNIGFFINPLSITSVDSVQEYFLFDFVGLQVLRIKK